MKKLSFLIILLVLSFVGTNFAQVKPPKVVKHVAPQYPAAALAVNATGEVIVAVKIDKEGKVFSAISERGHPLLRKSAEWAARNWRFSNNDEIEEREVKITFVYAAKDKKSDKDIIHFKKPYQLVLVKHYQFISAEDY
jgi:TonB family protein